MTQLDLKQLCSIIESRLKNKRLMVAIAGAPGSGKSTLAAALCQALNLVASRRCAVMPMDGYHFDNAILSERQLLSRKGAPETFDALGFAHDLQRIRLADTDVCVPVFDRNLDLSRAGAREIQASTQVVLIEGNYLLLNDGPWRLLHPLFDLSIVLDVPTSELERRLIDRWLSHGLSFELAQQRARENDIPNALVVTHRSRPADITWT